MPRGALRRFYAKLSTFLRSYNEIFLLHSCQKKKREHFTPLMSNAISLGSYQVLEPFAMTSGMLTYVKYNSYIKTNLSIKM